MRKLNALLYLFVMGLFLITACEDDHADEPQVPANTFNIDGKTKSLTVAGTFDFSGTTTESDQYLLVLTNTTSDYQVHIALNTPPNATTLAGTYIAATEGKEAAPNAFTYSFIGIDCTGEDELICEEEYETAEYPTGKVTISKDGNVHVVDFKITYSGGKVGTGNYRGSIIQVE
jgi:hypothetical protein